MSPGLALGAHAPRSCREMSFLSVPEGIDVSELRVSEQSLEAVFLQLTETPAEGPKP